MGAVIGVVGAGIAEGCWSAVSAIGAGNAVGGAVRAIQLWTVVKVL